MKVLIATHVPAGSRKGNRITAVRWARLIRQTGHRASIVDGYCGQPCDALVALHARHSARWVAAFSEQQPDRPLILGLTGTDLYDDIHHDASARRSLELADRLILLQPHGISQLPAEYHGKVRVIYQSVVVPRTVPPPLRSVFEMAVIGHLRDVKDPLLAARAARLLPGDSRIRVTQIGAALSDRWAREAHREAQRNPRYVWLGEMPHSQTKRRIGRARTLVVTSHMEGGANVICEAVAMKVPVLSTRISGSLGLLGDDHPGLFEVGDAAGLSRLMHKAECDRAFYRELARRSETLRKLVAPRREARSWAALLAEFSTGRGRR